MALSRGHNYNTNVLIVLYCTPVVKNITSTHNIYGKTMDSQKCLLL